LLWSKANLVALERAAEGQEKTESTKKGKTCRDEASIRKMKGEKERKTLRREEEREKTLKPAGSSESDASWKDHGQGGGD